MQDCVEKISADGTCKVSVRVLGNELHINRHILVEDIWGSSRTHISEADVGGATDMSLCLNNNGSTAIIGICPRPDKNGILQESMLIVRTYDEGTGESERDVNLHKVVEIIQVAASEDSSVIAVWSVTADGRHLVNVYNLVHGRYCHTFEIAMYHYPDTELALNNAGDILTIPVKDSAGLIDYVGYCYKDTRWVDIPDSELT